MTTKKIFYYTEKINEKIENEVIQFQEENIKNSLEKSQEVANYVNDLINNGKKVILVGNNKKVFDCYKSLLYHHKPLTCLASDNSKNRSVNITKFLEDERKLLLMKDSPDGIDGLQYTQCTDIVFGEVPSSLSKMHQVIARLDRYGQDKIIKCHFIINSNKIDIILLKKLSLLEEALKQKNKQEFIKNL